MSNRPNIFDYATSELSQDAFFAWLLEWAEDKYEQVGGGVLHKCAFNLLQTFFQDYYDEYKDDHAVGKKIEDINNFASVKKIKSVDVERQKKRIDLLLTIETIDKEIFYLIIEDKKMSKINGRKKMIRKMMVIS